MSSVSKFPFQQLSNVKAKLISKPLLKKPVESSGTEEASEPVKKERKKKEKSDDAEHKKKKLNPYTLFVKEQMALESVKNIPHKERMGFISTEWKKVDEATKERLAKEATELNAKE